MKRILAVSVLGAAVLAIAGCGGSDDTAVDASSPAAAAPPAAAATTTAAAAKVSANSASTGELSAALEAGGVNNAEKWADEIAEYRPYPADDTSFAKLRKELAKYNPAPDELEKIVSVLTP